MPSTGRPAYNPLNKWNNGPVSTSTGGGAMHLTSTPNTLQTEIGLASAATTPRPTGNSDIGKLICCAQYGQIGRNSDPNIGAQVNRFVNSTANLSPAKVTLANPPGLYIQQPNFGSYTTPDGTPASEFWTVKRGNLSLTDSYGRTLPGNFILHATFMVPESKGYTVSDIQISGIPILYASQINQTFEMQIVGQAIPQPPPAPAVQNCVGTPATLLAQPLQLFHQAVFESMYAATYSTVVGVTADLASNSTLIAPSVNAGATNVPMVLVPKPAAARSCPRTAPAPSTCWGLARRPAHGWHSRGRQWWRRRWGRLDPSPCSPGQPLAHRHRDQPCAGTARSASRVSIVARAGANFVAPLQARPAARRPVYHRAACHPAVS